MSEYVLEMNQISKTFSGIKVLDRVSLRVKPGQVHALMGENGAGKSTLMKILMGIYTADEGSGEILLEGRPIVNQNPRAALDEGISMIHQELSPVLDMQVYENLFLGREIHSKGIVNKKEMICASAEVIQRLGVNISPTAYMRDLSVAQQQLIEIAKALSVGAKVVIMDEPTSAISDKEIDVLFTQIRNLQQQNVAVIYISHKMEEIFKISDHITVLRDGCLVGSEPAQNLNRESLIRLMVGRDITDVYPKTEAELGAVKFEVRGLSYGKLVNDVSFAVRSGEILGIAGLVGAGRSELVEAIFGYRKRTSGTILVDGREVDIRSPKDAIVCGIALITEDRKQTGLNLIGDVKENITLAALKKLVRLGVIRRRPERDAAAQYVNKLRIKTPGVDTPMSDLSGGNQQKVVLSKWLFTEADIYIFDEPTRGIDVGAKRDIYQLMGGFARQGKAVIMISSEIPEVMGLSDRILVMAAGRATGIIEREDFSQEQIMRLATQFEEA